MTRTEIVSEFKRMSRQEQLALLKTLASVVEEEKPRAKRKRTLKALYGALSVKTIADPKETPKQRAKRLASLPTAEEITGIIRVGEYIPSDKEIKEGYVQYLIDKYK
jgi:hypothetical protein